MKSNQQSPMLIEVEHLQKFFTVNKGQTLKAVNDLNFGIRKGETLGMVGESGCGKSTAGRTLLRLYEPTGGSVKFNGEKLWRHEALS